MSVAEVGVHFLRRREGGSRDGRGMAVPLLARQAREEFVLLAHQAETHTSLERRIQSMIGSRCTE